jgi:putative transposase
LAIILDLFSRMIVGWSISSRIKAKLVTDAMEQAFMNCEVEAGLIFHSDRGSQYTSNMVKRLLEEH